MAELKKRIPHVQCKGWCWRSCTAISITDLERKAIEDRHGIHIRVNPAQVAVKLANSSICPALDENKRCRIWEDKQVYPPVCSAFGATQHMPCEFGCIPEGGHMSIADYMLLQMEVDELGGTKGIGITAMDRRRLRQTLSTRTGRRRYEEKVLAEVEPLLQWWREYAHRNPDGLDLGETDEVDPAIGTE